MLVDVMLTVVVLAAGGFLTLALALTLADRREAKRWAKAREAYWQGLSHDEPADAD
jgi:hypothetical protein